MEPITTLIAAADLGDEDALERLFAVLYPDLKRLAHAKLRRSADMTLLNTTALVNESYLRLFQAQAITVKDRAHFMGYAARVMRSIVVDTIRSKEAWRHGGDDTHITLNNELADTLGSSEEEVLHVHEALAELAQIDERLVRVVEMRYFAGMTIDEVAESMGVTHRTIARDWEKARLFLFEALKNSG